MNMTIEIAHGVGPAKIDIAYERLGSPDDPPVLLVMGLGAQLIAWPDGLCNALVERGLQVIRFDNRDAGQSTHFHHAPPSPPPYTLSDMAGDAVGLLDQLGIAGAHVVGASLGGFVAQTIAIEHPTRIRTLTAIMSSTGSSSVGQAAPHVMAQLLRPPPSSRAEAIEQTVRTFELIGSPGFERDVAAVRERAALSYDRGYDPAGVMRQLAASFASGNRTTKLRALTVPTLVIHGADDPLVGVSGGRAIADAIPGARLVVIDGMGHDLPRALWPRFADEIAAHAKRA